MEIRVFNICFSFQIVLVYLKKKTLSVLIQFILNHNEHSISFFVQKSIVLIIF